MRLELQFDMSNAAFDEDANALAGEILAEVGALVARGMTAGIIRDPNGNNVGIFKIVGRASRTEAARKAALTRSANLSPERRSEIARNAAKARWG
jgi:hypothetical protein